MQSMKNENTTDINMKNRKPLRINRKVTIILSSIVLAALIIAVFNTGFFDFGVKAPVNTYASDSKPGYRSYDEGYIQYTKDGAKFLTRSGKQLWNDSYTMNSPAFSQRGKYTAVFETSGRAVRVYDNDGLIYNIQTSDPIQQTSISECGYVGVITYGDKYSVSVYSTSGSLIFQRIEAETGVYPFCSDISPNGESIAISYVDTTGAEISAKVGLFYIDAAKGEGYSDSMYAAVEKADEIILGNYFVSSGGLIVVSDRNIIYISSSGTEEWSVEVTNEILGVGLCGDKLALVYGDELSDKEGVESGTVAFVTSSGKFKKGYCIGADPDFFSISNGGVVVGSGSSYYGINLSGKVAWSISDSGNLNGIYPTDNIKMCIYATKTWSVVADMTNFDSSAYSSDTVVANTEADSEIKSEDDKDKEVKENNTEKADTSENKNVEETLSEGKAQS